MTQQGVVDLARAQVLESRRKHRTVCESEPVEAALREFVEKHDLLGKTPRARRAPPMPEKCDGTRSPRAIPSEVARDLMQRHDDMCAIGYCENKIWLENSHHTPHAVGGGNELEHQDRICSMHHRMKDHGELRWVPASSEGAEGRYETLEGGIMHLKPIQPGCGPPRDGQMRARGVPYVASRMSPVGARAAVRKRWGRPAYAMHSAHTTHMPHVPR